MKGLLRFVVIFLFMLLLNCSEDSDKNERCSLEPDAGLCLAAFQRYYYDMADKKCKSFTWGGCGGVVPFETMEECEKGCGNN